MKHENDELIFETTGKTVYAFSGQIGLQAGKNAGYADVTYGYDGTLCEGLGSDFTKAELDELCDHMIARWEEFRRARS